ncbi:BglG family transcription antiterminator [Psychrobacillus sp. FJAT-51614]|uniref:BglG family transcription antiterminator n=1 Tax=Psychrobacillus mangrovi TaxID=3117745 RepID=A0ABU8FAE0_9BACI
MYIQSRLQGILAALYNEKDNIKGEELAKMLDVSTRTLRSDIKSLNDVLESVSAFISSTRYGYKLDIKDPEAFSKFYHQLSNQSENEHNIPQENEKRIDYLLKKLLMTNTYLKAEELAAELYISKSSLTRLLKGVKDRLSSFDLSIIIRPNYGLKVMGEEIQKRACISEFFFPKRGETPLASQSSFFNSYFSQSELQTIENVVFQRLKDTGINVNDIGFENLVIHLAISIKRIQMGTEIDQYPLPNKMVHESREFQVMSQILHDLHKIFQIFFSDGEKFYLTVHLIGNRSSSQGWGFEDKEKELNLTLLVVNTIYEVMGLDLRKDMELQRNLTIHLQQAFTRLLLGHRIRNPLIQEITSHYPVAFEAAVLAVSILEKELKLSINKEETGFIAIHLQAAIERINGTRDPKRCLIVCGTGQGSAILLKYKLMDYFGGLLDVIDTMGYYDWRNYSPPSNTDFIITTISTDLETTLPVIKVHHILGASDFERIQEAFFHKRKEALSFIEKDLIFLQMPLKNKEEVIHFLSSRVVEQRLADSEFEQAVLEREKFMETSFGNLVALPHPIQNISTKTFLAFCTLPKPIIWGTTTVQLVCLFSVKQNNKEDLQYLYDFLYEVLNDTDLISELVKIETVQTFLDRLKLK